MSTTFEVFPSIALRPTFSNVLEESTKELQKYLSYFHIFAQPELMVSLKLKSNDQDLPFNLTAPAEWSEDSYAWFHVKGVRGGTDAYFWNIDEIKQEWWESNLMESPRAKKFETQIAHCLETGYYWHFRRSAGQPAAINVAYGIIAACFARLTQGIIFTDDGAWDYECFPATADEFLTWYFIPEKALSEGKREWSMRCVRYLSEELVS
jgi:hypothetical protein